MYIRTNDGKDLKLPVDVFHSTDAFVDFVDEEGEVVTVRLDGKMNTTHSAADVMVYYPRRRFETDEDIYEIADRAAGDVVDALLSKI